MTFNTKYAQRRSMTRQIGRALNPMEHARRFISPEYGEVAEEIKRIDSEMREQALGQKDELREFLHEARIAMKQRKFPSVVYYAWKIVSSIDGVFEKVDYLNKLKDNYLEQNYGKTELAPSQVSEMEGALGDQKKDLKKNVRFPKAANMQMLLYATAAPDASLVTKADLVSEAGPMQWVKENIPSFEGMKIDMMDRVFRNRSHKQREAARDAMRIAEKAFSSIKKVFDNLDSYRTDFGAYVDEANKAKNMFDADVKTLSSLYKEHFSHIRPQDKPQESTEEETDESSKEESNVDPIDVQTDELVVEPDMVSDELDWTGLEQSQAPTETDWQTWQPAFDFNQPQTQEQLEEQQVAAASIVDLIGRSKVSLGSGQKGIALALLAKASEICDDYGAEKSSTRILSIAQSIAK